MKWPHPKRKSLRLVSQLSKKKTHMNRDKFARVFLAYRVEYVEHLVNGYRRFQRSSIPVWIHLLEGLDHLHKLWENLRWGFFNQRKRHTVRTCIDLRFLSLNVQCKNLRGPVIVLTTPGEMEKKVKPWPLSAIAYFTMTIWRAAFVEQ